MDDCGVCCVGEAGGAKMREEERRVLTRGIGGEGAIMSELPLNGVHGGGGGGEEEEERGNVICFGSFKTVLDVSSGEGIGNGSLGEEVEGEGRDDVENWGGGSVRRRECKTGRAGQCGTEKQSKGSCERALENAGGASVDSCRGANTGAGANTETEVEDIAPDSSMGADEERDRNLQSGCNGCAETNGSGEPEIDANESRSVFSNGGSSQSPEANSSMVDTGPGGESIATERDAAENLQEVPQLMPPVMLSADQRSVSVEWKGCPMAVTYHLDAACNEVAKKPKKVAVSTVPNSAVLPASSISESDLKWNTVYVGRERKYKVGQLKPGSTHFFRLRAVPISVSPLAAPPSPRRSDIVEFSTLPSAPFSPSAPILVNRARTSLKVKWSAPSETGGLPIMEYFVVMTPPPGKSDVNSAYPSSSDGFVQVYRGQETAAKVTRLLPGTTYRFRVSAANSIGQSEKSREVSYTTDASVPAAPPPPKLVFANASCLTVHWQEFSFLFFNNQPDTSSQYQPLHNCKVFTISLAQLAEEPQNCGSPITHYTLECDDGEGGSFVPVYYGEDRLYTMKSLKSGHVYRVRVMAHNDRGKGAFSVPAELLTGFSPPNPPPPPTLTGRSTTTVSLTWCRPERDGGSPITAYELEMGPLSPHGGWTLVYYGVRTMCTLSGLCAGHQFQVRVRAVNLMGKSAFSVAAPFSTSAGPPLAPSAPTLLESGSSTLTLSWLPPEIDGGSPITAFRLEMNESGQNGSKEDTSTKGREEHEGRKGFVTVYRGNESRFVVERLRPGFHYCFQVQAHNKLGAGPYSDISTLKTSPAPPTAPNPPVIVGSPASRVLSLRWHPSESNGSPIISYQLQMLVLGYGEKCLPASDDILCGNKNELQGENFSKDLAITSSTEHRGRRDPSSPFSHGVPHSPSHSISSASSRGTCTWDSEKSSQKFRSPPSNSGASEDEYEAQEMNGGHEKAVEPSHPDDCGSTTKECHPNVALCKVYEGSSTAYTVSKLQPFTSYAFRVQAQNDQGLSDYSSFAVAMTASDTPCAPCPPITLETTSNSVTLGWEVPEQDNGSPVYRYSLQTAKVGFNKGVVPQKEQYNIALNGGKKSSKKKHGKRIAMDLSDSQALFWDEIYAGNALQFKVLDLLPGHCYSFRVVAHNDLGKSPPSASMDVTTLASSPGAPQSPIFSSITPTSVRVRWSAPTCDNGMPVTSYKLMMDDGKGGRLRKVYEGGATSHKAIKLVPASTYCVAVQAINALGASALSEVATVKLPMAPPHTPPAPKVEVLTEKSFHVDWLDLSKEHDGSEVADSIHHGEGVAIAVSFTLEMEDLSVSGKFIQLYEGSSTSFKVENLATDHTFRFRVRANGASGAGLSLWSSWSTSITVERQAASLKVNGKSSIMEELERSISVISEKARQLQYPWALKTRRWLVILGVALTLGSSYFTVAD